MKIKSIKPGTSVSVKETEPPKVPDPQRGDWYVDASTPERSTYLLTRIIGHSGRKDEWILSDIQTGTIYTDPAATAMGAFGGDFKDFVRVRHASVEIQLKP